MYTHFDLNFALTVADKQTEGCLDTVQFWMADNSTCINNDKTHSLPIVSASAGEH